MAHYLKNKDLLVEVIRSKELGRPTDKLVDMFILLAEQASHRLYYTDPMDREDCVAGAVADLVRNWSKFDETRFSNAFAYYTQVVKNGFAKTWHSLGHKPGSPQVVSLTALNYLDGFSDED